MERGGSEDRRLYLCEWIVLSFLVDKRRRHARVDDNAAFVTALEPELGGRNSSIENTKNVGLVDVVKVLLVEFGSGLDDGDTSVLCICV